MTGEPPTNGVWGGIVEMTEERYMLLASLASQSLVAARPYSVPIGEPTAGEQNAIYVAVNESGYACYAGQTRPVTPRGSAAAGRIAQHLSSISKREEWTAYWVIPLHEETPQETLNRLEREVCARLGLPVRNLRWRTREKGYYPTP